MKKLILALCLLVSLVISCPWLNGGNARASNKAHGSSNHIDTATVHNDCCHKDVEDTVPRPEDIQYPDMFVMDYVMWQVKPCEGLLGC